MTTQRIYALPVEITEWKFDGATEMPVQLGIRGGLGAAARAL